MIELPGVEILTLRPQPKPDIRVMWLPYGYGGPLPAPLIYHTHTTWYHNEENQFVYGETTEVYYDDLPKAWFPIYWNRWIILDEHNHYVGTLREEEVSNPTLYQVVP